MIHILPRLFHAAGAALIILILLAPVSASAAVSDWAENEGGRMRLVISPPDADGRRLGALEIEPLNGWITYWREPGDSGIPPQLAPDPGSPHTISPLRFPVPKRLDTGDVRDIGYDGPVVLPFVLETSAEGSNDPLNATAFIGLCRNICIPFQANFSMPLIPDPAKDAEATAVIAKAETTMPEAPSEDFAVDTVEMADDLSSLTVTITLPGSSRGDPQLFVTGPSGYVFTEFNGRRKPNGDYEAIFPIDKLPKGYTITNQQWRLLAISTLRAMEAPLAFD